MDQQKVGLVVALGVGIGTAMSASLGSAGLLVGLMMAFAIVSAGRVARRDER